MSGPTVFIGYNRKDAGWKDRLVTHLKVVGGEGWFDVWDDQMIQGGEDRLVKIHQTVDRAKVAIPLISAYFLVSDFMRDRLVPHLLERRSQSNLIVFPVIVRSCKWEKIPWLSGIQVRPQGRPVAARKGDAIDEVLAEIAEEVFKIVEQGSPAPEPIPPGRTLRPWIGTPV